MSDTARADQPRVGIEEYARLPDDGTRTELVRGRVVREPQPGYEHGRLQARIPELLRRHVREAGLDLVCVGNLGVILSEEPPTVRGPDAAVIRRSRLPSPHHAGFLRGAPELAIEVVPASNTASEIQEKVAGYLGAGAEGVWVIYPETRTVAVHESPGAARFLREGEALTGGSLMPDLRMPVAELFEEG